CTLCNQACQVRDPRNPLVSCIADPHTGYESVEEPPPLEPVALLGGSQARRHLLVVGGGPAGLECARVAALGGLRVTVLERSGRLGGMAVAASRLPGHGRFARLVGWLEAECRLAGVELVMEHEAALEELDAHEGPIVCCTGSRPGRRSFALAQFAPALTAAEVLEAERLVGEAAPSPAVVFDPIGGPVGIGVAETLASLGAAVMLVTPHFVAGEQLARTGDLAPANVRLLRAGVTIARRSLICSVGASSITIEHRDSGEVSVMPLAVFVDAGHRLAEDSLCRSISAVRAGVLVAGDAVAPRTVLEAVLDARRVAMGLCRSAKELADP
ncbi:MAG: NAD-binding protein, partial [Actinomycetota bacterium]|nr:NAD-binding protein [Actinomycetota bacterium]